MTDTAESNAADGSSSLHDLADVLDGWSNEELGNLGSLLEMGRIFEADQIIDRIKWLYHSKARAGTEAFTKNTLGRLRSKLSDYKHSSSQTENLRKVPTYDELIIGVCKHLKAFDEASSIEEHELFLTHAVITAALQKMEPRERQKFFEQQVAYSEITSKANVSGPDLKGPATTFALLGAAQASGFGIYLASTTALGFLTHAVGVTLPFAIYTGMTSTIAFLIGPAGWLGAGIWSTWKLTEPEWKKLVPALVCIVATNSLKNLQAARLK